MAMIACGECRTDISSAAKSCPKCGWKPAKTRWWLVIPGLALAAFLGFGAILSNTEEGKDKAAARGAIALCWKDHERKSISPSDKLFVASVCERMEDDFSYRFGVRP